MGGYWISKQTVRRRQQVPPACNLSQPARVLTTEQGRKLVNRQLVTSCSV